jgi:hypothetical protein
MSAPESRPILDLSDRAKARFDEACSLARQLAEAERSWVRLGRLLTLMERDKDWERLGFDSIDACIMEIEALTGYSRSSIYAFRKLYEECSRNFVTVPEMPLSSGHLFKQLPAALQRDPDVIESAKKLKPKQFRQKIQDDYADAHVEQTHDVHLHLEASLYSLWREAIDTVRMLDNVTASYEQVFETILGLAIEELRAEARAAQ